jgi:indole-3-glycerol phosphate synthase / phosphoribosylanthranilate isomerase
VAAYARAGAAAISVLSDTRFFGGSYEDLRLARRQLDGLEQAPLLLQKDFILDPIQLYLARAAGADIILLIAAILAPERLEQLRHLAESLGMGVLVEVHDQAEFEQIRHLPFPVLGVNNRDLKTFRTSLNRVNTFQKIAGNRFLIAESGIQNATDFQVVRQADGFLIGTGLMRNGQFGVSGLGHFFENRGRYLLKSCGMRTVADYQSHDADLVGINFSPLSKRRAQAGLLDHIGRDKKLRTGAVAVFYKNSEKEIRQTLDQFAFRRVQLYAEEVSPQWLRQLPQKVVLASKITRISDLERLEDYAAEVDFFILDGATPGSGQPIQLRIPENFPYPFLLAGGMQAGNLDRIRGFQHCIGVDAASGIESDGRVDAEKIRQMRLELDALAMGISISF